MTSASGAPKQQKKLGNGKVARSVVELKYDWFYNIAAYGLLLLVMAAPFFRGLFFAKDQMVWLLLALGVFVVWWGYKLLHRDDGFLRLPIEYWALGLVAVYVLSSFGSLSVRSAIQEVLKNLLYFLALWLTLETTRSDSDRKRVMAAIFVTGILVALFGAGNAAKLFSYTGAFGGGRIGSSFQYPNTLASYLTVSALIGFTLQADENPPWIAWGIASGLGIILLTLVFTYSRGGLLVFPIVALVLALITPRTYRRALILSLVTSWIGAGVATPLFSAGLAHNSSGAPIWGGVILAAVTSVGGQLLGSKFFSFARVSRFTRMLIAMVVVIAGVVAFGIFLARGSAQGLGERLVNISLHDHNVLERFQFTKDALKIVGDHPLLGTGGGGFAATYHAYQAYGYMSTQVHNHFVQTLVETGVMGFAVYLGLWEASLFSYWRLLRRREDQRTLLLAGGALVGALALGLHGWMDFNLSLSSVSLALWILWGVAASPDRNNGHGGSPRNSKPRRPSQAPAVVAVALAAALSVFVGRLYAGYFADREGIQEAKAGETTKAVGDLRRSAALDPFQAGTLVSLGSLEVTLGRQAHSQTLGQVGLRDLKRGLGLERTNPAYQAAYGSTTLQLGYFDEGLQAYEQALKLQPFSQNRYEDLAKAYVSVGKYYIDRNKRDQADRILAKVPLLAVELAQKHDQVPSFAFDFQTTPASTPTLKLYTGEALALLGRPADAKVNLTAALDDPSTHSEALAWLSALAVKRGELVPDQGSKSATSTLVQQVAEIISLLP